MKAGRKKQDDVRDWVVTILTERGEMTLPQFYEAFRTTHFDFLPSTLYSVIQELRGTHPKLLSEKKIRVERWLTRRGRFQPVYVIGSKPDCAPPEPTKVALKQRRRRAEDRAILEADRQRREVERQRALKRRPAMDALTAALFGRPIPSRSK